jgi:hypothetical protein
MRSGEIIMSRTITFETAVTRGRRAVMAQGKANWALGDIAASVKPEYGEETVQKLAEAIFVNYNSLLNYRTIASAYAPEERTDNSFSVHEIFAPLADHVALVAEKIWTVSEARALVASRKTGDVIDPEGDDQDGDDQDGDAPETDERAELVRKLEIARTNLANAEAALAKWDAEHPSAPARHTGIRGVPQHDVDAPRADCPKCQAAGLVTVTEITPARSRRTRKAAA